MLCESPYCRRDPETGKLQPRLVAPWLRLCPVCRNRLQSDLISLFKLNQDCEQVLAHPYSGIRERISGSKATGIPLNEAAMAARLAMVSVLASWSKMVAEERGVAGPEQREISTLVNFLAGHIDWLAAHSAVRDFVEEITDLVRNARQAAYPDGRFTVELGPCIEDGCESIVKAVMHGHDDLLPHHVRCDSGHAWQPHQWLLLGKRIEQLKQDNDKDRLGREKGEV